MLELNNLSTIYTEPTGEKVHAVNDVSIDIQENEIIGIVGESGSGKSTLGKSILGILDRNGKVADGEILFNGDDISDYSEKDLKRHVRWSEISMIPQNTMNSLDPVYTVGEQIIQVIRHHEDVTKAEARERAEDWFGKLGIEKSRLDDYPHQFSGGMAQRGMIALAMALNPSIVIADEPTTGLDVVIQDRILHEFKNVLKEINGTIILITHDMSVVSEVCDRVAVMYGGQIVEIGDVEQIIMNPRHPYTLGLRNAFPDITKESQELVSIPGDPPKLSEVTPGCDFAPRCPFAKDECWNTELPTDSFGEDHLVKCIRADEKELLDRESQKRETWQQIKMRETND